LEVLNSRILAASSVPFETRTTFDQTVLTSADLDSITRYLTAHGITKPNKIQEARTLGAPPAYIARLKS
jgi:hypothetical protein